MRIGSSIFVGLCIGVFLACGDPLRQDELDCEEAVSVLTGCCPGFQPSQLQCIYQAPPGYSCGSTTYPALTEEVSSCIRNETCAELVASNVCTRAQAARGYTQGGDEGANDEEPAQVCP